MPESIKISICIICFNEERNIQNCLESASWADEIIVVDSGSTDRTIEIIKQYDTKLFRRPWTGYVDQKNYAFSKAGGDWILSLDADEMISAGLREEILHIIEWSGPADGYRIPRLSFYQDRWIRHCGFYPDKQLRLVKRGKGSWVGGRVHERVEINGSVGALKNDILHYPYKGSIVGQLQTLNNFTTLQAEDLYERGKRFHLILLLFRPLFKFLEVYILKKGFLDGIAGLIIAVTFSYSMFVRYVKLRELDLRDS
ncbi:MAG: glycosyltransferase family 2 protein [Deltaproteobacteria bacterium]|nr:glycosyltransferase family 2 protein [Deltaproteobacteria bacterium]